MIRYEILVKFVKLPSAYPRFLTIELLNFTVFSPCIAKKCIFNIQQVFLFM